MVDTCSTNNTGADNKGNYNFRTERMDYYGEIMGAAAEDDHAVVSLTGGRTGVEQEHSQYAAWQNGG